MTTYPLNLPSTNFSSFSMTRERLVATNQSEFTYAKQIYRHPGERWRMVASLPALERDDAEEWKAFLLALDGPFGTFLAGDAVYEAKGPRGSWLLTSSPAGPLVLTTTAARQTSLPLYGFVPSQTNVVRKGDYIQLGTGTSARLHAVVEDANSNSSGEVTLEIRPATRVSIPADTTVVWQSPKGCFRLRENDASWQVNTNHHYTLTLDAEEAI